jgi:hypothetical protein
MRRHTHHCGCSGGNTTDALRVTRVIRCDDHAAVHARQLTRWRTATFAQRLAAAGELASA